MGSSSAEASIVIRASIERVFDALSDHEGMARWPGVSASRLTVDGVPRNGLGAVRRITAGGLTLDEKVVRWDPPRGYDYQIIRGLPVKHLGTVALVAIPSGVEVKWHVELASSIPLLARFVAFTLRAGLPRALKHVAKTLEREASPSR